MPFTLSHVAAVVPLIRILGRRTSFSALAIGAMVPDLGYYVRSWTLAVRMHTVAGALTWGVLAGLVLYVWFQWLVRPAYVRLAPYWVARRLDVRASQGGWPSQHPVWSVLLCMSVGALTHVTWDSFTHVGAASTWGPWFAKRSFDPLWPHYRVLQHLSTVLGAVVVAMAAGLWLGQAPVRLAHGQARHGRWGHPLVLLSMLWLPLAAGVGGAFFALRSFTPFEPFAVQVAYVGGASWLVLVTLVSILVRVSAIGR